MVEILGRACDPKFWTDEVRVKPLYERYREQCLNYWEREDLENKVFPALRYSDYKLFWTTGDRGIFERSYFSRRYALEYTLPLALMYPEEEKYLKAIMDWVYMICDEYSWCLPAHQGPIEPNNNSRIDLFASECGFWLALVYHLLGDRIDPLIKNRIAYEINRRIIDPFLAVENYGWWEVGHSNWTAVCVCGVAASFMLMRPELMDDALIARFDKAMNGFVDGFKDDGICLEGCGYWAYGVGFFVMYADMLRTFTGGRVNWFSHPRMKAIATFPQRMFLSGNAAVSFADGGRVIEYPVGVLHRLKDEFPEDVLIYSPDYGCYGIGCGRVGYRIFAAVWMREEYYFDPADSTTAFESYAADSQWLMKRTAAYGFAAKAGHNSELHNHNDVGSFIFAKNGKQQLVDIGAGKYTRQYFSSERYTILECAGFGHSLPLFDGATQKTGSEYAATDVHYESGCFTMDIAGAYALENVRSARRSFVMEDDRVVLTDEFDCDAQVIDRVIALSEPKSIAPGKLAVGDATVEYDATLADLRIGVDNSNEKRPVYLIDFILKDGVRTFKATMR